MNKIFWTSKKNEKLLQLKEQGLTWDQISIKLNNSIEACKSHYKVLKRKSNDPQTTPPESVHETLPLNEKYGLNNFWTPYKLSSLYNLKEEGFSFDEISKTLRCEENECAEAYSKINWDEFFADPANKSLAHHHLFNEDIYKTSEEKYEERIASEKTRLLEKNERLLLEQLLKERAKTEILIEVVKDAVYKIPHIKPTLKTPEPSTTNPDAEEMGLMLSDSHIGEKFTLQDTNGLSEYNLEVFKQRIKRLEKSIINIANKHMHLYPIPCLNVFALGDLVHGMNMAGAWGPANMEIDVVNQMFTGMSSVAETLIEWTKVFPKIKFYGVYGNHGRGGKFEKDIVNWDYLLYKFLEMSLSQYDNIQFDISTAWWQKATVKNHVFMLVHGDDFKSQLGLPYYGLERGERRTIGMIREIFNYMLVGHHHRAAEIETNSGFIITNGSFTGGDPYSLKKLQSTSTPSQRIFGIHEKYGITWQYILNLKENI